MPTVDSGGPDRTGAALRNSEALYRGFFDTSPNAFVLVDSAGHIAMANTAARVLLGYTLQELQALPPLGLMDTSDPRLFIALQERSRTGRFRGELILSRADGTAFPADVATVSFTDEAGAAWNSISIYDLAEEKRNAETQRFLVDAGRILVTVLEYDELPHTLVRLVVPRLADFSCIDIIGENGEGHRAAIAHRDPVLEKTLRQAPCICAPAKMPTGIQRALDTGASKLDVNVANGSLFTDAEDPECPRITRQLAPRSAMVLPLIARGQILGALTLVSTRPGRRYDQADLAAAESLAHRAAIAMDNARLYQASRQATRIRDEVLAVVSHDLRNPIHTIGLSAGLLMDFLPDISERSAAVRRQIEIILRSVDRANHLIRDLLDVARIQGGGIPLQRSIEATAPLLLEVIELHAALAAEQGVTLEVTASGSLPSIYADRDRILQVFSNLIGNAVKFTPGGGRITVHAENIGSVLCFAVIDSGPGIPAVDIPHLFDPFWQATEGGKGGVGLGLPIAQGIVEAHGGEIWVESRVGKGTTIFFTIPVASAEESVAATRR